MRHPDRFRSSKIVMQDQPLQGASWRFEERLCRSGAVSRAGVSARRELGWVLTLGSAHRWPSRGR